MRIYKRHALMPYTDLLQRPHRSTSHRCSCTASGTLACSGPTRARRTVSTSRAWRTRAAAAAASSSASSMNSCGSCSSKTSTCPPQLGKWQKVPCSDMDTVTCLECIASRVSPGASTAAVTAVTDGQVRQRRVESAEQLSACANHPLFRGWLAAHTARGGDHQGSSGCAAHCAAPAQQRLRHEPARHDARYASSMRSLCSNVQRQSRLPVVLRT